MSRSRRKLQEPGFTFEEFYKDRDRRNHQLKRQANDIEKAKRELEVKLFVSVRAPLSGDPYDITHYEHQLNAYRQVVRESKGYYELRILPDQFVVSRRRKGGVSMLPQITFKDDTVVAASPVELNGDGPELTRSVLRFDGEQYIVEDVVYSKNGKTLQAIYNTNVFRGDYAGALIHFARKMLNKGIDIYAKEHQEMATIKKLEQDPKPFKIYLHWGSEHVSSFEDEQPYCYEFATQAEIDTFKLWLNEHDGWCDCRVCDKNGKPI